MAQAKSAVKRRRLDSNAAETLRKCLSVNIGAERNLGNIWNIAREEGDMVGEKQFRNHVEMYLLEAKQCYKSHALEASDPGQDAVQVQIADLPRLMSFLLSQKSWMSQLLAEKLQAVDYLTAILYFDEAQAANVLGVEKNEVLFDIHELS